LPRGTDKDWIRERLYAQMVLIRRFEERILELFAAGELFGTTHCYIGQEANAVGIVNHLEPRDVIFSSHRCHGHFLARTGKDDATCDAEILGEDKLEIRRLVLGRPGTAMVVADGGPRSEISRRRRGF
jgi:TPP-dependent pyruvate/acetoin dehydrogenase alpha subunit